MQCCSRSFYLMKSKLFIHLDRRGQIRVCFQIQLLELCAICGSSLVSIFLYFNITVCPSFSCNSYVQLLYGSPKIIEQINVVFHDPIAIFLHNFRIIIMGKLIPHLQHFHPGVI